MAGDRLVFVDSKGGYMYGFPVDCPGDCRATWRTLTSEPTEPAVADGVVYVAGAPGGGLAAVPEDCGAAGAACRPLWVGDLHGSPTSPVVVASGVVYVGSSDGNLYAFPTRCGETGIGCAPAAVVRIGSSISKPALWQDRALFVTALDGTLRALTVDSGEI